MKALSLAISIAMSCTSCATIMTQNEAIVTLQSGEPGTKYYVDNRRIRGKGASVSTEINQRRDHIFSGKKSGCENTSVDFKNGISGWIWGNIIFGGFIGLIVDLAAGGLRVAKQTKYDVTPMCDE